MSLTKLLRKRTIEKTKFIKLKTTIESFLTSDEIGDISKVTFYSEELKTSKMKIEQVFETIFDECKEDELNNFLEECEEILEGYNNLAIQFKCLEAKLCAESEKSKGFIKQNRDIKLPDLQIPIFTGAIDQWLSFCDLFTATVHNNTTLSDAQRLQYLKSVLRGDAAKIIQYMPIVNANYAIAWDLLSERYSNRRELVYAHIKRLISQPNVINESPSAILNLVDTTTECVRSLEILDQKVSDFSEVLITYLVVHKLDASTKLWWERQLRGDKLPTLSELTTFLKDHARSLQASKYGGNVRKDTGHSKKITSMTTSVNCSEVCKLCNAKQHKIYKCPDFLKLNIDERIQWVKEQRLCFNCLGERHRVSSCKSNKTCSQCKKAHHSTLHFPTRETSQYKQRCTDVDRGNILKQSVYPVPSTSEESESNSNQSVNSKEVTSCVGNLNEYRNAMLATALIRVRDSNGSQQLCRAFLDPGSTASFISESAVQRLGLKRRNATLPITSLGSISSGSTQGVVEVEFTPHFDLHKTFHSKLFVLRKITSDQPPYRYNNEFFSRFSNITFADPKWFDPAPIDILLGVSISLAAIKGEKIFAESGTPFAINSEFGWLIAGDSGVFSEGKSGLAVNHASVQSDQIVKRFWELETVPSALLPTKEEALCEDHFTKTHSRDESGRYVVRLPFKPNSPELGDSRTMAVRRLMSLEKRFDIQPDLRENYELFLKEYLDLGHMEKIPEEEVIKPINTTFYLPHHPVFKESSTTTKLRVVFNASAKSSSGVSLNEKLLVGARIQQELFLILLRFRTHPVAFTADVTKMFRQIKISPEDADFQRIVWRNKTSDDIGDYRLSTVTYGTASAPFLSTRVLKQLALDENLDFPEASKIVLRDFYVDDLLSGASSAEEAIDLIYQIRGMLEKGGFELRKWCSNDSKVLNSIPSELRETQLDMDIETDNSIKVLGITWHPSHDNFSINVTDQSAEKEPSKRFVLSVLARIFDPLGWLSPFVVSAKILLQELWSCELAWDEPLPEHLSCKWMKLYTDLMSLRMIRIPRAILLANPTTIELHAFCDACEKAYGTVIYLRSVSKDSVVGVNLIAAKTRVAPLKTITLPRLELCAALLLAHLLKVVQNALQLKIDKIYAWSDSTVVLSWLSSEPRRWQTFVANRVSEIQQIIPIESWHHIQGKENPADCASRGLLPSELVSHGLWWHGPHWLSDITFEVHNITNWTRNDVALTEERKKLECTLTNVNDEMPLISKVSSLNKLQRIIAWCLRFKHNSRSQCSEKKYGQLTSDELNNALTCLLRYAQKSEFFTEIQQIRAGKCLKTNSKIATLCPFLDKDGLLRVGGRLRHSQLGENHIHPILLPKNHHLTYLIVKHYHISHLHAGPQLLLSVIRHKFWIISGVGVVRRFVKKCVKCFRLSASLANQMMADLPPSRVIPSSPFTKTGVDYAGPFNCKEKSSRNIKTFKCYIAIFVCFSTRAIHLELVTDLSTQALLAALRRFIARRGKPNEILSDCATNFIGASRELKEMYKFVTSMKNNEEFTSFFASEGIKWAFNPPAAPHFGGLWEAGVKSMKYHLKRTMGNSVLTFEELSTLLAQIEACLNSRPLCPLSSDPNDFMALTPGHFLIGRPLTSFPEPEVTEIPLSSLRRWQLVQRVFQHFWRRWSSEYLTRLQQRPKWCNAKPNLQIGDLVLLKNETAPPLLWKLGRITKIHPGPDKKVRVVTVQTDTSEFKRPIAKLCRLPLD